MEPPRPPTIAEIDQRSEKLFGEGREMVARLLDDLMREHRDELVGKGFDRGRAFEGWSVQKLSSLQLYVEYLERLVLHLAGRVDALEGGPNHRQ